MLYDARSGALRWTFHTIPHPGEFGYDTWPKDAWQYVGGANAWSGMSLDEKRGLVFAPTGSATYDFYGSNRHGDNLFAESLVCLEAETGKRVWHFQAVHHGLWDYDTPAAPNLIDITVGERRIKARRFVIATGSSAGAIFRSSRGKSSLLPPTPSADVSTGEGSSSSFKLGPAANPASANGILPRCANCITSRQTSAGSWPPRTLFIGWPLSLPIHTPAVMYAV